MQHSTRVFHDYSHRSEQALALEFELAKLELKSDVLISCGLNTVEKALSEKREDELLISIGDPQKHHSHFNCLILPSHEPHPNHRCIISCNGLLNNISSKISALPNEPLFTELPAPKVAVLLAGKHVGGDIAVYDAKKIAAALNKYAASALITTSKRTEEGILTALELSLKIPYESYNFQKDGQVLNPYLNMLNEAEVVIVTADSLRMVSESCSSAKTTYIYSPEKLHFSYAALADALIEKGYAKRFSEFGEKAGETKTLQEAKRIAEIVAGLGAKTL